MGDQGPCGPSSEIHVDIRSEEEKAKIDGASLVNKDHPLGSGDLESCFYSIQSKGKWHLGTTYLKNM